MDWMVSEYNRGRAEVDQAVFTGKSVECRGSLGRREATARGLTVCVREWAARKGVPLQGKTFIVQGFGNVGANVALLLVPLGMTCVGVGDHTGYRVNDEGFNVHKLAELAARQNCIEGYTSGTAVSRDEFFGTKCNFVIPAALEMQITAEKVGLMQCDAVFEAANGPVSADAESVLLEKGVDVIPDVLCNSGGVIVSYFEWVQNMQHTYWSEHEVVNRMEERMRATFERVVACTNKHSCSFRKACYLLALTRLQHNAVLTG